MSSDDALTAVDALVDENMALREEIDDANDERDAAKQRAEQAEAAAATPDAPLIGFADGTAVDDEARGPSSLTGEPGSELETAIAERDSYLADSQRLAADFANFRKQSEKRVTDAAAAQSAALVRNLLPVLDACDSAIGQDAESAVTPIRSALLGELERSGLELLAPELESPFDPELHEAVMHEVSEDEADASEPRIAEIFRAGYLWKGRVVRPAMVKVVG